MVQWTNLQWVNSEKFGTLELGLLAGWLTTFGRGLKFKSLLLIKIFDFPLCLAQVTALLQQAFLMLYQANTTTRLFY